MACKDCGHVFPKAVTMGVAAAHMFTQHNITSSHVDLDLVWIGSYPCPDARWQPCTLTERCYRPSGHNGGCRDVLTIKR